MWLTSAVSCPNLHRLDQAGGWVAGFAIRFPPSDSPAAAPTRTAPSRHRFRPAVSGHRAPISGAVPPTESTSAFACIWGSHTMGQSRSILLPAFFAAGLLPAGIAAASPPSVQPGTAVIDGLASEW